MKKLSEMNEKKLRAEVRYARKDCDETGEIHKRLMAERDEARADLYKARENIYFTVLNLIQERDDLAARIQRLNLRLSGLGYLKEAGFEAVLKAREGVKNV